MKVWLILVFLTAHGDRRESIFPMDSMAACEARGQQIAADWITRPEHRGWRLVEPVVIRCRVGMEERAL